MTIAEMIFAGLWLLTLALWFQTMKALKTWALAALKAYAAAHDLRSEIE